MWCRCAHCGSEFYCEPNDFPSIGIAIGICDARQDDEGHIRDNTLGLYFCSRDCWEIYATPIHQARMAEERAKEQALADAHSEKLSQCEYIDGAFYDGLNLVEVSLGTEHLVIPKGIAYINSDCLGEDTYDNSIRKQLISVTMPDDVSIIKKGTFRDCYNLSTVRFSENLTEIEDDAFYGCRSLKKITLPKSLKKIGESAFGGCSSLAEIEFPEGLEEIGRSAFGSCESLSSVQIPDTVKKIGAGAFNWCKSLVSVTLPKHIEEIEKEVFCCCKSLRSIQIPITVQKLGEGAFQSCESLTSLVFHDGLKDIECNAFYCCRALKMLVFPASINNGELGYRSFLFCPKLHTVMVTGGKLTPNTLYHLKFCLKAVKDGKWYRRGAKIIYGTEEEAMELISKQNK